MRFSLAAVLAVLLLPAAAAVAQPSVPAPAPDFLFGRPKASVAIRGGWLFSRAGSDWYDFVTQNLTLENNDFNRPTIGGDVGVVLSNRLEAIFSVDFNRASSISEYRDFVDNRRLPIEQQTTLRQTNVGGALKYYLTPRGYEVSRLAWVPRTLVPYVGAGGGVLWFEMVQTGDFVDFVDSSVFTDAFRSSGTTPSAHVFGGVELKAWRRLFLTLDGRYLWAAGDLGPDWIDFEPIDLTGTRLSAGIKVIF
jgi:opacity protein-like surface antigen